MDAFKDDNRRRLYVLSLTGSEMCCKVIDGDLAVFTLNEFV